MTGDMLGPSAAVIGVGINVQGAESLGVDVGLPVTDIAAHLGYVDRNVLLREIVLRLDQLLTVFEASGFEPFRNAWQAMHAHQNQPVRVKTGLGEWISGEAVGIDASGALLLADGQCIQRFHSGEVSVRGAL